MVWWGKVPLPFGNVCGVPSIGRDSGTHAAAPHAALQGAADRWVARTARQGLRTSFGVFSAGRFPGMCVAVALSTRQAVSPPRDEPGVQEGVLHGAPLKPGLHQSVACWVGECPSTRRLL